MLRSLVAPWTAVATSEEKSKLVALNKGLGGGRGKAREIKLKETATCFLTGPEAVMVSWLTSRRGVAKNHRTDHISASTSASNLFQFV